jgi:uncharacterized radical SAM superfamily Fe-S cluster-containing enzyme
MDSLLGVTNSVCESCRTLVPARLLGRDDSVYLHKFCPVHGEKSALVRTGMEDYLRTLRYVKPAWIPEAFAGQVQAPCPQGCGFCERHEQHLCMPIIEVTSRCDLACPVCLVDAGAAWDMSRAEFSRILDGLVRAERKIDLLNLSGGEPLVHPDLLGLVDEALKRPEIIRVSLSTNGLRLLRDRRLLRELRDRNVVLSLQFDGFSEGPYEVLRRRPLLREKLELLDLFEAEGVTASLTMTAAAGLNDDQFPAVLECLFSRAFLVSLMIQPVAFAGRAGAMAGLIPRLTIPDVIRALDQAGHSAVRAADFVPLPCSHPACFSAAFYLMLRGGGAIGVTRLAEIGTIMDVLANRVIFGLDSGDHEKLKQLAYELWSGPVALAPDGPAVIQTVRALLDALCGCGGARDLFRSAERHVKSIFIHAFQDAATFDLARVRRCCQGYPQPDGGVIPACVRNNMHGRVGKG